MSNGIARKKLWPWHDPRRYQKQIEDAGRKVLGKEKFAELKNMARGAGTELELIIKSR